jgi:hypothetical protein
MDWDFAPYYLTVNNYTSQGAIVEGLSEEEYSKHLPYF